jgi:hypothetical protein
MPTVELSWNPKQSRFILSEAKRLNLEGGVRAGKTWALLYKVWDWCRRFPGIRIVLTRWSQDALDAQLKPEWRRVCHMLGTTIVWHADEEYDEFPTGSVVYLRALHTSDDSKRYSKLAGLTVSVIAIDQAEEVEEDVLKHYVPARLSQPGFPHALWITPNPPMPDHWIAKRWPEDGSNPGHELIVTTPYDNQVTLGEEYIRDLEVEYPPDSLEYRRLIMGKRGLVVSGQPIYARHFREREHVASEGATLVSCDPYTPLLESWDFGTLRPCVVWGQFPSDGRMHVLGGVMGDDVPLELFIPIVQEYRASWFPSVSTGVLQWTCDPAGQIPNSHGSRTAVDILRDFGIYPLVRENANDPRVRAAAIQQTIGYLRRRAHDGGPVFRLHPRFVVVAEGGRRDVPVLEQLFEGGYTYDPKRTYSGTQYKGLVPPRKDGYYEHPANALEYLVTVFAPPHAAELAGLVRNPAADQRARKLLRARGIEEPSDRSVANLARVIQQARAENQREKEEWRRLRRAQRDDGEPFRWNRDTWPGHRGGYAPVRRP